MSSPTLYTIGNFTIDDIVLWPSGKIWMTQPGGNALFSALGARIWLEQVCIIARIGYDYPQELVARIQDRGILLSLHEIEARTLHDWALYEAEGARQFVNHLNSGSNVEMTLHPQEIPLKHRWGRAYHIAPVPTDLQAGLVAELRRPGCLIALDPHGSWITGHEDEIHRMLDGVDLFLPSEVEAQRLYGSDDFEAAARAFAALGPKVVVIKMGNQGSLIYDENRDELTRVPIFPAQVEDPTGAGDAYCGGFLAGYILTGDPVMAGQYGTVSASYVVEAVGALATVQPTKSEAEERLAAVAELTRSHVKI